MYRLAQETFSNTVISHPRGHEVAVKEIATCGTHPASAAQSRAQPIASRYVLLWAFAAAALLPLLILSATVSPVLAYEDTEIVGGPGGTLNIKRCPPRTFLVGLHLLQGSWLDGVNPRCLPKDESGEFDYTLPAYNPGPFGNTEGIFSSAYLDCRSKQVIRGLEVMTVYHWPSERTFVADVHVICENPFDGTREVRSSGFRQATGKEHSYRGYKTILCPGRGGAAVGVTGATGSYVDRIGLICSSLDVPETIPPPNDPLRKAPKPLPTDSPPHDPLRKGPSLTPKKSTESGSPGPASSCGAPGGTATVVIPEPDLTKLNVREKPGGKVLSTIPEGAKVSIVGPCGSEPAAGLSASEQSTAASGWCQIDAPVSGCVSAKYLQLGGSGGAAGIAPGN